MSIRWRKFYPVMEDELTTLGEVSFAGGIGVGMVIGGLVCSFAALAAPALALALGGTVLCIFERLAYLKRIQRIKADTYFEGNEAFRESETPRP